MLMIRINFSLKETKFQMQCSNYLDSFFAIYDRYFT